jgi:hypothetical protein
MSTVDRHVTGRLVAAGRHDLAQVEVDGELLVYDEKARTIHHLNGSASLLWDCLDGSGSLEDIAADIADVYGIDGGRVLEDIVEAARDLAAKGLLVGAGSDADVAGSDADVAGAGPAAGLDLDPRYVQELGRPCMDRSFTLGADGMTAVAVGSRILGLRASTPELVAAARAVFAPAVVDAADVPPNVSVVLTDGGAARGLYWIYRSGALLAKARGPRRALQAAAAMLSSYDGPSEGMVDLAAPALVRGGQAAVVSPMARHLLDRVGPRVRRAGWSEVDGPTVTVDPATGEIVVPRLAVAVDGAALDAMEGDPLDAPAPAPGRYRVAAWVSVGNEPGEGAGHAARAAEVAALGDGADPELILAAASRLTAGAAWRHVDEFDPGAIAEQLLALPD